MVGYDNYNFADRVRDQALGVPYSTMRSLTTSLCAKCPHLPPTGLHQGMHDPSKPLDYDDFVEAPSMRRRDLVSVQCTNYFIADAIRTVHPGPFNRIFQGKEELIPKMPEIDRLPPKPVTELHHLGAIFYDEGTIEGTYQVHDDIWLSKMKFSDDPAKQDFANRLWLVHGDQKTAELIRSLKSQQRLAEREYDRRDWMLGPPAFWHILQSLTFMIIRTHWDSPDKTCKYACNLQYDITNWNRGGISRENAKYHMVEPLIKQSWTARILAMFYEVVDGDDYLSGALKRRHTDQNLAHTYGEELQRMSPESILRAIDEVRSRIFTYDAWVGKGRDGEYTTMCRFLQEIELFLTLRHAIKHGDIGVIRRMLEPLTIFFFGAEQHKYGYEMLHLRWLMTDGVSDPALQRSILASGLVNTSGRPDSFQAFDLVIEHVNCMYKLDMRNLKNSTHDVNSTFDRLALTCAFSTRLRRVIETFFGEKTKNDHTRRSVIAEVFGLAFKLWDDGRCHSRSRQGSGYVDAQATSQDLIITGLNRLADKVEDLNARVVDDIIPVLSGKELEMDPSEALFVDVAGYAEAHDEDFYTMDDDPMFRE